MPEAPLVDVSDIPVADLVAAESPALAACVARLLDDVTNGGEVLSAFQSFASQ